MKTSVASMIALAGALASATPIVNKPAAAKAPESRASAGPLKPFYVEGAFCGIRNKSLDRRIDALLEQDEFCRGTEFFCKQPEIVGEGGEFANEAQCLQSREKKQFFEPKDKACSGARPLIAGTLSSDEPCEGTVEFCKHDDIKRKFGDDPNLCVASRALNNKSLKNSIKSENKEVTNGKDTKEQGGASMPFLQPSPKDCGPSLSKFTSIEEEKCLGTAKFCEQFPGGDNVVENPGFAEFESKDECLKAHKPDTKAPASKPKSEKTKQPKKETKDTGKNTTPGAKPEEKPKSEKTKQPKKETKDTGKNTTPGAKPEEKPKSTAPATPAKKPEAPKPEAPKPQPQDSDRLVFSDRK